MKRIALILSLCTGLGMAGCAQYNAVISSLGSAETTQAIANLKAGATVLVCAIASISSVTSQVEAAVNAGKAIQTTTGQVLVSSTIVCDALGGTVVAKTTLPALQ